MSDYWSQLKNKHVLVDPEESAQVDPDLVQKS